MEQQVKPCRYQGNHEGLCFNKRHEAFQKMHKLLGRLLEGNGVCVHNQNPTEFPHTCYEPLICEEARRIKAEIDDA